MVVIAEQADALLWMALNETPHHTIGLVLASVTRECRFSETVFELPLQLDRTGFQLKHMVRATQEKTGEMCIESVFTAYSPEHYWPLTTAREVVLHLPDGPVTLNDEALAHLRSHTPRRPPEKPLKDEQYVQLINQLNAMLADGQAAKAREVAEVLLPLMVSRPPYEGAAFFAMLGMARRLTGDVDIAAGSYETAILIAAQLPGSAPDLGVMYDNLATARRLQKRWADAEAASDRAIALLTSDDPRARHSLGAALNNRAISLSEQGRYAEALDYSDRALAVLGEVYKDKPKLLKPFIADNRGIREKASRR